LPSAILQAMRYSQHIVAIIILFTVTGTAYSSPSYQEAMVVEIFTTSDLVGQWEHVDSNKKAHQNIILQLYRVNGIQHIEAELSRDLSADPSEAKQSVLRRIHNLDEQSRSEMQTSAMALAKAMQYGIDRFPAIVFDGQTVVYGVKDLKVALAYFQEWQARAKL